MKRKIFSIVFALVLALGLSLVTAPVPTVADTPPADIEAASLTATNRLTATQNNDGGWEWGTEKVPVDTDPATGIPSPYNTLGVTAQGVLDIYRITRNPANLDTCVAAYNAMVVNAGDTDPKIHRIRGPDIPFLVELSEVTADSTYADFAKARYEVALAEYADGTATGFAQYIRDVRIGHGLPAIISWDINLYIQGALALDRYFPGEGYGADAVAMAEVIYDSLYVDPVDFDFVDDTQDEYWLAYTGAIEAFATTGTHGAEVATLVGDLLDSQQTDGSFVGVGEGWDTQTTAYAVMALLKVGETAAAKAGVEYLEGAQFGNGGIGDEVENTEVTSEMTQAIFDFIQATGKVALDRDSDGTVEVMTLTIQLAIDGSSDGDTINVAAGMYNERVDINKSLTLEGANAGIPATGVRGPESIINPQGLGLDFGVLIYGADTIATFDGFTVENYERAGILAGAFSLPNDPAVVHILNNIVTEPIGQQNNNCIQVGDGTTGTVIGNEVSGANLESPDWSGSGILVAGSSNVLVSNNYVHNCEGGIQIAGYTEYRDAPAENNLIEYNLVEDNESGIVPQMYSMGTIIRYNDVLNNDIGVEVMAIDVSWEHSTPSGTEVHYNDIVGNIDYGVKSGVWGSDTGAVLAEEVDAINNWWDSKSGPTHAGNTFQAWGSDPIPQGEVVSDNVLYCPWLDAPAPGTSFAPVVNDTTGEGFSSIQAAIDDADTLNGHTITCAAGTYEETVEVDVEGLTIRSSEGPLVTTVKGHKHEGSGWWGSVGYYDIAFQVIASGVTIEGFTIDQDRSTLDDPVWTGFNRPAIMIGGWFPGDYGHLGVERVTIRNNVFVDTWSAIYVWKSSHNLISGNIIEGCYWRSIQVYDGSDNGQIAYDPGYSYSNPPIRDWQGTELFFDEGELICPSRYNRVIGNEIAGGHFGGIFVGAWPGSGGLWTDNTGTEVTGNYVHDDSDIALGTAFSTGAKAFSGNTIEFCRIGTYIFGDGATGVTVHFNNIIGNTEFGVLNEVPETVDATHNWWGTRDGAIIATMVSGNVTYSPWIGAGVRDSRSEGTESGPDTIDARTEADTEVIKTGTGTPTVTVAEYSSNPGRGFTGSTGRYVDVHVDNPAGVDEIEIRVYYTDAEIGGLVESSLILRWWDGTRWIACSDTGVNTTDIPGSPPYSGYIWAKIRNDTRPTLAQLSGTVFGGSGRVPTVVPSPPPAPPAPPPGTTDVSGEVSTAGIFLRLVTAISEDGLCTLTIVEGTVGLTAELEPLTEITIVIMDEPPPPPEGAYVIGLVYDFQPSGATFEPPVTLKYTYDPAGIPEGVAEEDLVIAYYDEAAGEWVVLDGCVVDPVANTITAPVAHFTAFRAMVFIPAEEEPATSAAEEETATSPPEEVPPAPAVKPFPWPLVGGIIVAVVVVGLVTFLLVRRRRA